MCATIPQSFKTIIKRSMNNYLMLRSIDSIIQELNDKRETFFIPSYQRGYRWTSRQVGDLLNDLWEFAKRPQKREEDIYCLQPVVVTRRSPECWEVIDGQQRLTTIRIILSFINNEVFRSSDDAFVIEYETRPGSQAFLNQIDKNRKDENIDYFHIGDSDECDHSIPAQADHPFRAKLTSAFRGKLTTPNA
jgi:uncharacterized protein with ParB-like and HNH nuclease domain